MRGQEIVGFVKETWADFSNDKAARLAAAIAYSAIFSLVPLFIIMIAVAGAFFGLSNGGHGHHIAQQMIVGQISSAMGPDAGKTVDAMITASYAARKQGLVASIISWIVFIIGAMGLFASLQDALNTVWNVQPKKSGITQLVRDRAASLGLVLGIGFLLLLSSFANAALAFVTAYLRQLLPVPGMGVLLQLASYAISLAVVTLLFAAIFKVLPDAEIRWNDVWSGAFVTAVLFVVGQVFIAFYLGRAGVTSTYGAVGSILAILLWVYYSAMILLLGAEFTKVYARRHGSAITSIAA